MKNRLFFLSMFASLMIVLSMQNVFAYTSADLAVVSANFGRSDCSELNNWCSGADMNRDGVVGGGDVDMISANFDKEINANNIGENYDRIDCNAGNGWCNGGDLNQDGMVSIGDVVIAEENDAILTINGSISSSGGENAVQSDEVNVSVVGDNYNRTDCSELNNWCSGADMNRDGNVSIGDVVILAENNVSNQQVAQEPSASPVSSSGGSGSSSGSSGGVIFAPLSAKKSATSSNDNSESNLEVEEALTQIETDDATFLDGSFNYLMESVESKNSQIRLGASVVILFSAGLLLYFRKKRN